MEQVVTGMEQSVAGGQDQTVVNCLSCGSLASGRYCWNCGESLKSDKEKYPAMLAHQYQERAFVHINDKDEIVREPFLTKLSECFGDFFIQADTVMVRTNDIAFARFSQLVLILNGDGKTNDEMKVFMESFARHAEQNQDQWQRSNKDLMTMAIYFVFNEGAPKGFFDEVNIQRRSLNPLNPKNWAELNRRRKHLGDITNATFYPQSMSIDLKSGEVEGICLELTKAEIISKLGNFADRMPVAKPKKSWVKFVEEIFGDEFGDDLSKMSFLKEQLRMVYSATLLSYLIKTRRITVLKFIVFFGAMVTISQLLSSIADAYTGPIHRVLTMTDYEIINVGIAVIPLSLLGLINHLVFKLFGGVATMQQTLMATWMSGVLLVPAIQIAAFLGADDTSSAVESTVVACLTFAVLYLGPLFKRLHEVGQIKATLLTAVFYCSMVGLLASNAL